MQRSSHIKPEVRARILEAIEELHREGGGALPTVAVVRARAGVDMNACSAIVSEWKASRGARPTPMAVAVPDSVMAVQHEHAAVVWNAAYEEATASLRAAESRWDQERSDAEAMRLELSDAFEAAKAAADEAREELAQALASNAELAKQVQALSDQLGQTRENLAQQTARADEVERRAGDLKVELDKAHDECAQVRQELRDVRLSSSAELEKQRNVAAGQIERLNEALASAKARVESHKELIEQKQAELAACQAVAAQVSTLEAEVGRLRAGLAEKESQLETVVHERITQAAQLKELQRSHDAARNEAEQARQMASEYAQESARSGGILQELQRQNTELMARLTPPKARPSKPS